MCVSGGSFVFDYFAVCLGKLLAVMDTCSPLVLVQSCAFFLQCFGHHLGPLFVGPIKAWAGPVASFALCLAVCANYVVTEVFLCVERSITHVL